MRFPFQGDVCAAVVPCSGCPLSRKKPAFQGWPPWAAHIHTPSEASPELSKPVGGETAQTRLMSSHLPAPFPDHSLIWLPRVVSGIPGFLCGNKSFLWPPGVGCEFVPVTTAKAGFWLWEQHFRQLLIPISTDLPKFQMPPWRSILKSWDSAM